MFKQISLIGSEFISVNGIEGGVIGIIGMFLSVSDLYNIITFLTS